MSIILTLLILAVAAVIVSWIPMEPLFRRICYLIIGVAAVIILLRLLFPGVI